MLSCSACGTDAAPDDAFCQACGTALIAAAATVSMMPPIAPAPADVTELAGDGDGHHAAAPTAFADVESARAADQLVGRSQPNQTYLGHRLVYEQEVTESIDPIGWTFMKEMLRQAATITTASIALGLFPMLFLLLGVVGGNGALRVLGLLGLFVAGPVLWAYFWFHRIDAVKSEWKLLIDDQAAVADQVFSHITWALKRRNTPIKELRVRRLSQPGRDDRDYLELKDGVFTGFISAFAYGEDLYIGWTMWWSMSPFRWYITYFGRIYMRFTGRGTSIYLVHRYEKAKAMREAMHSAAREGVDAATGSVAYQGAGTIGSDLEVAVVASTANVPRFIAASTE
jgi:hypothetical protein